MKQKENAGRTIADAENGSKSAGTFGKHNPETGAFLGAKTSGTEHSRNQRRAF